MNLYLKKLRVHRNKIIIGICCMAVVIFLVWFFGIRKTRYYMDITAIGWRSVINIGEYQKVHYTGWEEPPDDAYNVESWTKIKSKDSDGQPIYDIWFEYYRNEWKYSRCLVGSGFDKEPVYPACQLYYVDVLHEDTLGNEKVLSKYIEYEVSGVCSDISKNILTYNIPKNIWLEATVDDWIGFDKKMLSDNLQNVALCKLGDGIK